MNIITITELFHMAVIDAEKANTIYKIDRENRKVVANYLRALRKCDRLRRQLKHLMESGKL